MGSFPYNILCCYKPNIESKPKSDLFVPQINIEAIKSNRNIERNFVTSIKEKSPKKRRDLIKSSQLSN